MKLLKIVILLMLPVVLSGQISNDLEMFRDTVYINPTTGNYVVKYVGTSSIGQDTLITFDFIPSNKLNPSINTSVEYNKEESKYLYKYRISNGTDSEQWLEDFYIMFFDDVDIENRQTNKWHGGDYHDFIEENDIYIGWWGDGGLGPGWSTDGFAIASKYLPGIGEAGARGSSSMPVYEYGLPDQQVEDQLFDLTVGRPSFAIRAAVIPIKKLVSLAPEVFLDTLISYNERSYSLGWIKEQDDFEELKENLLEIKEKLSGEEEEGEIENEDNETVEKLNELIEEVEELYQESKITSETYALLKYNTEYLIKQLSGGEEEDDGN